MNTKLGNCRHSQAAIPRTSHILSKTKFQLSFWVTFPSRKHALPRTKKHSWDPIQRPYFAIIFHFIIIYHSANESNSHASLIPSSISGHGISIGCFAGHEFPPRLEDIWNTNSGKQVANEYRLVSWEENLFKQQTRQTSANLIAPTNKVWFLQAVRKTSTTAIGTEHVSEPMFAYTCLINRQGTEVCSGWGRFSSWERGQARELSHRIVESRVIGYASAKKHRRQETAQSAAACIRIVPIPTGTAVMVP